MKRPKQVDLVKKHPVWEEAPKARLPIIEVTLTLLSLFVAFAWWHSH